jgi:hypothetical protein
MNLDQLGQPYPIQPSTSSSVPTPEDDLQPIAASPADPSLAELFLTMSNAMKQMAVKVHNLEVLLQAQAPTSIEETLMNFLTNTEFEDRVNEIIEHYLRYNFEIDDHLDIDDAVRDVINNNMTISFDI